MGNAPACHSSFTNLATKQLGASTPLTEPIMQMGEMIAVIKMFQVPPIIGKNGNFTI